MADVKNLLLATAGNAGGPGLDVDEVFATTRYTGTSGNHDIVNGLDLSTEGGWLWFKRTNGNNDHFTVDNVNGLNKYLVPNSSGTGSTHTSVSYNNNGFSLSTNLGDNNESGALYINYSFRRAPKFFDIVSYTGNDTNRTIAHNLGSVPGMIIIKKTTAAGDWGVYHREMARNSEDSTAPEQVYVVLQKTDKREDQDTWWNDTAPTASAFSLGSRSDINQNGQSFVAYLFAHHNNDGEFGETGDKDIIKCGGYTGGGSSNLVEVDVGFEPQWLMIKRVDDNEDWIILDSIRGINALKDNHSSVALRPNQSSNDSQEFAQATGTGFKCQTGNAKINASNGEYIYVAIRKGSLNKPTDATKVFAIDQGDTTNTAPQLVSGFPVDLGIFKNIGNSDSWVLSSRKSQPRILNLEEVDQPGSNSVYSFDFNNGWLATTLGTAWYSWMWKHAPSYFDELVWTGTGSTLNLKHSLGVKPEAILIKQRIGSTGWIWWFDAFGNNQTFARGDLGNQTFTNTSYLNDTAPTATQITLGSHNNVNGSGGDKHYVGFLWATAAGVSKVGSYTGNGSNQNIDCGFSNGARFVLIKRTDSSGDWCTFDTTRGIAAGNDKLLRWNDDNFQTDSTDEIDPYSGGFNVVQDSNGNNLNVSSATYVFIAIA